MRIPLRALFASLLLVSTAFASDLEWTNVGFGTAGVNGVPKLVGKGALTAGGAITLDLTRGAPNSSAVLVIGFSRVDLPLFGGTLVPAPDIVIQPIPTDNAGGFHLEGTWPAGSAAGVATWYQVWMNDAAAPVGYSASNSLMATTSDGPEPGTFPTTWINGTNCGSEPKYQIHAYNEDFYILRQSVCTNFEAPFIFLIFGSNKVLMIDSGAGNAPIATTVQGVINNWLAAKGQSSIQLIVAHTHGHGDHVAGDGQMASLANTTVVGTSQNSVKNFFGISSWPTQIVTYDLGGERIIDIIPIPGHQSAHIAFYDRRTANLITGDSLYPGRLYVFGAISSGNWPVYQASIQRLVDFTSTRDVCNVLGTHIEMSNVPGVDYPIGASSHPNEHPLQLERAHLIELNNSVQALGSSPVIQIHDDFIIYPSG